MDHRTWGGPVELLSIGPLPRSRDFYFADRVCSVHDNTFGLFSFVNHYAFHWQNDLSLDLICSHIWDHQQYQYITEKSDPYSH